MNSKGGQILSKGGQMPPVPPINQTLMWPIVHRKSRNYFVEIYILKMRIVKK